MKAAFGTVENVRKVPSRHVVQVITEYPIEAYVGLVNLLDGKKALMTVSELDLPFGVVDSQETKESPPASAKAEQRAKMGPLCSWAVMRCQEPEFREFLREVEAYWAELPRLPPDLDEQSAKLVLCAMCNVDSRKDLDEDEESAEIFKRKIMEPWSKSPLNPHRQAA